MKTRKRHLTARIKPATRAAILDQLAGIADGIIDQRAALEDTRDYLGVRERAAVMAWDQLRLARDEQVREYCEGRLSPWYARLMWWRK